MQNPKTNNKFTKGKTYLIGTLKENSKARKEYKNVPIDKSKSWYEKPADWFIDLGYTNFADYLSENPNNLPADNVYYIFEYDTETQFYNLVYKSQPNENDMNDEVGSETFPTNNLSDKILDLQSELYTKNIETIESQKDREIQMLREQLKTIQEDRKINEIPYLEKLSETERNYKDLIVTKDNTITMLLDRVQSLQNELIEQKQTSAQLKSDYEHQLKLMELEKSLNEKFDAEQTATLGKLDELEAGSKFNLGKIVENLSQHPQAISVLDRAMNLIEGLASKFSGNNQQGGPTQNYNQPNQYANNFVGAATPNNYSPNSNNFNNLSPEQQEAIRNQIEMEAYMQQQQMSNVKAPDLNSVPNFN